ncbi:MAG: CAP domain-containing protein [Methanoregulaceae archaeon]|nr:CAP domain-containing protein [Methanoregulaceae archaeon]
MGRSSSIAFAVLLILGCAILCAHPVAAAEQSQPDLIITGVTAPSSAVLGGKVFLSATVKNAGSGDSSYSYTYFYISKDMVIDSSDSYLGRAYSASLAPAGSRAVSCSALVPSVPAGSFYILAKADGSNRISEGNEENNIGISDRLTIGPRLPTVTPTPVPSPGATPVTTQAQKPDLVISGMITPPVAVPGGKASLSTTVRNEGGAHAPYSYLYYYLSADTVQDTGDTYLGRAYLSPISPGTSRTVSNSLAIPSQISGTVYLCAIADGSGRIAEKNEGNNAGFSNPVTVQAGQIPGPTPSPAPSPAIILKPDLFALSVNGPDSGTAGNALAVQILVRNNGTTFSGSSLAALYLSTDKVITPGDSYIGSVSVPSVSAGSTVTVGGNIALPATIAAGTYYLGTIIDQADVIREIDEGNNVAFDNGPVTITWPVPGGSVEAQVEAAILKYTNQERIASGVSPLVQDPLLTSVARAHSLDMKERNFFSHANPDGLSPFQRMAAAGYRYSAAAENIAATSAFTLSSSPDEAGRYFVQEMWMQSTGHRENILSSAYTRIGIGVVYEPDRSSSPYGFIATQDFGRP